MTDEGPKLWLRHEPLGDRPAGLYRALFRQVAVDGRSATARVIREELTRGSRRS